MPYAIAALATAAAFLLRLLLAPALGTDAPLLAFMFAVMVAGWYGGLVPALLATAVSALLGVLFFIPPTYGLALPDTADRVNALVFLGIGALTSWLTESLHRARERAAESAAGERASEERYRLLVDAVQDYAIVLLDPEGRIASWNSGAERIQGYHADEILGRHVSLFYPPDEVERGEPERHIARALSAGRAEYEAWRVRKNGSRFWANVVLTAIRDEAQGLRGFVKVTRDITERKQTEDALRESAEALRDREAQMSGIIDSAMDAIVTVDADQRVRAFNVAAEAMFGYRAAEILGEPLSRLLPDRFHGVHQGHVRGFGRSGTTSRSMGSLGALMGRRADGTEFPIEASISQVAAGGKALYTAIVRDITERERAGKPCTTPTSASTGSPPGSRSRCSSRRPRTSSRASPWLRSTRRPGTRRAWAVTFSTCSPCPAGGSRW
jgi:PAS domain S-box-containing protein